MKEKSSLPILRLLQIAAYTIIILWGIRAAASILGPLLLGLLLAYAVVPFPKWLIKRFKFSKGKAIAVTAVAAVTSGLYLFFALDLAALRIEGKLPTYVQHLDSLYDKVTFFMNAHGIAAPIVSVKNMLTPERLREITGVVLPETGMLISNGLLIFLLGFLFVLEMAEEIDVKGGGLAERLAYYAPDAQNYVAVTAKTAGINALVNLVFLLVMGVDTPVLWCLLYFFLDFIPTLGFMIALIPPTFVTLLMFGWQRALLVASGLILSNLIVGNVVTPIFMKKAVDISPLEIVLSLVGWSFLLGLPGAILAIPLTLALRRFITNRSRDERLVMGPSG